MLPDVRLEYDVVEVEEALHILGVVEFSRLPVHHLLKHVLPIRRLTSDVVS